MSTSMRERLFWVIFLLFLYPIGVVSAARIVSIQVSGDSFSVDEPFEITASASGFADGEAAHVKGAFYMSGSTNYFGFSRAGDGIWIENIQSAIHQPQVVIGTWNNRLMVRGDPDDSGYQGEGEYLLKLGYYYKTATGTLSPVQWSTNSIPVILRDPETTPTPSPRPTATCTPTAASTPTPTAAATATRSPAPVSRRSTPVKISAPIDTTSSGILGIYTTATGGGARRQTHQAEPIRKVLPRSVFALLFAGIGTALAAFAVAMQKISVWKNLRQPGG